MEIWGFYGGTQQRVNEGVPVGCFIVACFFLPYISFDILFLVLFSCFPTLYLTDSLYFLVLYFFFKIVATLRARAKGISREEGRRRTVSVWMAVFLFRRNAQGKERGKQTPREIT